MSPLKFGLSFRHWPRNPDAPDPDKVRLRTRASGPVGPPLV